jgi:hypothetical protein
MIERLIRPEMTVFEFGCGNSTRWWMQRVARVVAVDHDESWAAEVAAGVPPPHAVVARPPNHRDVHKAVTGYLHRIEESGIDTAAMNDGRPDRDFAAYLSVLSAAPPGTFDIIVVDGMARNTAAALAADVIKSAGAVIVDNSDRDYAAGFRALRNKGFRRIDFWGPGPINPYPWCTSIFTRGVDIFPD